MEQEMNKKFFVYMLASEFYGTLYTGMTSDLPERIGKHKEGTYDGFTKAHNVKNLVWFEPHESAESAIKKEKRLKK